MSRIVELLADSACRFLTLVGPGGIGKSRLAVQAASNLLDRFSDGVRLVPLQSTRSTAFLTATVADALDFSLRGQEDPLVQLLTHLRYKEMLLLLDNFEHLLPAPISSDANPDIDEMELLTGILKSAPAIKLLVTSRETLNLQGEWLFPVQGLPFPESDLDDDVGAYEAIQLFVERTRQVRPDFSLAEEQAGVVRLCQLVEGMPLALELAASWTKTLRSEAIAAKIEQSLEFLTSRLRDAPERHRSMQAVFDQSWSLLTETEREVFRQLSLFQGSFPQEAAEAVAGASLTILTALVDKSLLRWEPEKRYQMHELLRQYAEERLQETPKTVVQVRHQHCAYYANFLHEREPDMLGGRQQEATAEIKTELENVRLAWQWAVEQTDVEAIQKSIKTLSLFYQFQSRYREGAEILAQAAARLDDQNPAGRLAETLAMVLVDQGWLYIRLGQLEAAKDVLERGRDLYTRLDISPPPGQATDPLIPLAIVATIVGNFTRAKALGEAARQRSESHQHQGNLPFAFYLLSRSALALGDYEAARQHIERAYALVQKTNDRWFMAYCLIEMGNAALMLGDNARAEEHYQASYSLREAFDDPEGMAVAINHLGKLAIWRHDYAGARRYYQQSLAIYREINDKGGLATALNGQGAVACALEEYQIARRRFQQALQTALDIQFMPLALSILCGLGELLLQTEQLERGVEILTFIHHHPASPQETRTRAQQRLSQYQSKLSPEALTAATERGKQRDMEAIIAMTSTEAVAPPPAAVLPESVEPDVPSSSHPQPLVEPLTSRELEVLYYIAEGRTNREIADELSVVVGTVKAHASNIYSKLNVKNRTGAVARAKELDLL